METEREEHTPAPTAIPAAHLNRLFPVPRLTTLLAVGIVILLIYAFFARLTIQFYASVVFSFYAITNSMWVAVVLLGVFQTMLLIPFRIINLIKSANIKEFRDRFKQVRQKQEQRFLLERSVRQGRRVALFYLVNFFVQLVSYTSIGRLFLIDFYNKRLDPWLLYDFVPYPDYPIQDRFFKIPYLWFSDTIDLGMRWVWIAWGVILGIAVVMYVVKSYMKKKPATSVEAVDTPQGKVIETIKKYTSGRVVVFIVLAWLIIRHLPVGWEMRIFSGDVSIPNRKFNTLTAIVTFLTLIWVNLPKINKKVELARKAGMNEEVIKQTQKDLFADTLRVAGFVGLGAFFITNQIPSAFELSIFTLEIIALSSPLTLDRIILATRKQAEDAALAPAKMNQEKTTTPPEAAGESTVASG